MNKKFGFECEERLKPYGLGTQWKFKFPNGYGASVINDGYGREDGLFELAVLGKKGQIIYKNPVAQGDVRGYLKPIEVKKLLTQISKFVVAPKKERKVKRKDG